MALVRFLVSKVISMVSFYGELVLEGVFQRENLGMIGFACVERNGRNQEFKARIRRSSRM